MAPSTRSNPALSKKIATLQLTLAPFVPLPNGPPHPAFPRTLLAFHLLTEEELDSIAHYYHQSTPGPWTLHYPTTMNWDKDFLDSSRAVPLELTKKKRLSAKDEHFLASLMQTVSDLSSIFSPVETSYPSDHLSKSLTSELDLTKYHTLSDSDRIRIKRRKVGKFIGLVGMETPVEEIAGRLQASFDRAIERSRQELQRNEEVMLRRKKAA